MRRTLIAVAVLGLGCGSDVEMPASTGNAGTETATTPTGGDDETGAATDSADASETGSSMTADSDPSTSLPGSETTDPSSDGSGDSSDSGGPRGGGTIDVTLDGCTIDFGGTVVVSYNGSLGVASVYDGGATLTGSFQFDLEGSGVMQLSSQHRVDTGNVVNMVDVAQGTWTNLDSDALSGGVDSIAGTLTVETWNPAEGQARILFDAVSLLNVSDGNVCTIDGVVEATELYP